ncbi:MAG: phenylalanine--tRNA ligase subunit alpha [Candidatus ainarchaeum sp.]|nr:phenylalanine--tRNA ligase subunit alpha [Candidatus ainarchaeum sp.]MDD4220894.1 phenylalanine--tRNA ligase subunit alpha [Candidatus ainarchaeum sp.]
MKLNFTEIDKNVYDHIKSNKEISFEKLINNLEEDTDSVRRSLELLKDNNIISEQIKVINFYEISEIGKVAVKEGLVEKHFCDYLKNNVVKVSELKDLEINNFSKNDCSLAFGIAKNNNLISIEKGVIVVKADYDKLINKVLDNLKNIKEVSDQKVIDALLKRKLILKKQMTEKRYTFLEDADFEVVKDNTLFLSSKLLKSGEYKDIKFKEYEVSKLPKPKQIGRIHPLRQIIYYIRDLYLEMGFKEMTSPYVETSFWPMDSMFISQDHPMREIQDTFYLPDKGTLPDKELTGKIALVHESGGKTGSLGHQYKWDIEAAKQLVLRSHTTAATYRKFYELTDEEKKECKYFSIGKVFRNETIDSTHLPEFHHAEGFVIGKGLSLAHLIGFIKVFFKKLGIENIKIKPTYNPYTEPSVEVFAYLPSLGKWAEIMNSGVFRKESLEPYGIEGDVIAWGIGIERIAMLVYGKRNIKDIYGDECNIDWLRSYTLPPRKIK